MACGCPVIAAEAGATPEVLDGAGILFPPGDAEACSHAMQRLAANPALVQACILSGRTRAQRLTIAASRFLDDPVRRLP